MRIRMWDGDKEFWLEAESLEGAAWELLTVKTDLLNDWVRPYLRKYSYSWWTAHLQAEDGGPELLVVVGMQESDNNGVAKLKVGVAGLDYPEGTMLFDLGWRRGGEGDPVVAAPEDQNRLRVALGLPLVLGSVVIDLPVR